MSRSDRIKLAWVDGFIDRIRPHVAVRQSDGVVIRMPNQAFRVNETGARMLGYLLDGGRIAGLHRKLGVDLEKIDQVNRFFEDLAIVLGDRYCEQYRSEAIEHVQFRLGYIERPILSEVALTSRCNLKCRFCYAACAHTTENDCGDEAMTTEEVREILRRIRHQAEVPSVSFTGGEPTLRKDLSELIGYATKHLRMRVNLITNGTLIDRALVRRLRKVGLRSAQVSIEGPDAELHDRITGVSGSFGASCEGLRHLLDAGIAAHPHTTICRLNAHCVQDMAGLARRLGVERFSANIVIPAGRGMDPELDLPYSDIGEILDRVQREAQRESIRFMWYSPTPVCIYNPVANGFGNKGCSACEGLLSIDYRGHVIPCSSWAESLGNLRTEEFGEIWYSGRAREIRGKRLAWEGCHECESMAVCHGACPLYFAVHGYDELTVPLPRPVPEYAENPPPVPLYTENPPPVPLSQRGKLCESMTYVPPFFKGGAGGVPLENFKKEEQTP